MSNFSPLCRSLSLAFCLSVLVLFSYVSVSSAQEASEQEIGMLQFTSYCAGTFVSTNIDENRDGRPASMSTLDCFTKDERLGRHTLVYFSEFEISGESCVMDDKSTGVLFTLPLGTNARSAATKVRRFKGSVKKPEQIYTVIDTVTQCFNPKDLRFNLSGRGTIIGGTGRYEGATGRLQFTAKGQFGYVTPDGKEFMGAISENINIVSP